jgi:hypothetical protein
MGVVLQQVSRLVARGTAFHKDSAVVLRSVRQAEVFERYLRSAERRVECLLLEAQSRKFAPGDCQHHPHIHIRAG